MYQRKNNRVAVTSLLTLLPIMLGTYWYPQLQSPVSGCKLSAGLGSEHSSEHEHAWKITIFKAPCSIAMLVYPACSRDFSEASEPISAQQNTCHTYSDQVRLHPPVIVWNPHENAIFMGILPFQARSLLSTVSAWIMIHQPTNSSNNHAIMPKRGFLVRQVYHNHIH